MMEYAEVKKILEEQLQLLSEESRKASENALVGRATYINGDMQEFSDAGSYIQCIREELPYRATSGFRFETLTDDPAVRKAVSDIVYDFYGMENPHQSEDYETEPDLKMTIGGM